MLYVDAERQIQTSLSNRKSKSDLAPNQMHIFSPSLCLINYSSGVLRKYYQAVRQLCPIKMCYGCWFPTAHGHLAKSTASN